MAQGQRHGEQAQRVPGYTASAYLHALAIAALLSWAAVSP